MTKLHFVFHAIWVCVYCTFNVYIFGRLLPPAPKSDRFLTSLKLFKEKRPKCRLAIFEKLNGRINYDASRSSSLKFNMKKKHKNLSLQDQLLLLLELGNCKCYVQGQFNDLLRQKKCGDNRISFMHVNLCNLQWILSGPTNLLANLNLRFGLLESVRPGYKIIHITIIFLITSFLGVVALAPPLFRAMVQYFGQSIFTWIFENRFSKNINSFYYEAI